MYDGVQSEDTRVFSITPGDAATDSDGSKIASGEVGLATRWATGNQQTDSDAKVWEWWSGGSLCE